MVANLVEGLAAVTDYWQGGTAQLYRANVEATHHVLAAALAVALLVFGALF